MTAASGSHKGIRRHLLPTTAVLLATALVIVACGGSSDGAAGSDSGPTTTVSSAEPVALQGPGTPAPQPLPAETKATISVAFPVEAFASVYLADVMGEFEKENLDVEIVQLPANEGIVALTSGQVDLQLAGISAGAFNAIAADTDLQFVANGPTFGDEAEDGLWVRKELLGADGTIDPAKIPGMRIAFGSAGVSTTAAVPVARWLDRYDRSLDDITSVPLGGSDMLVALEQGSVDGSYLNSPQWQQPTVKECCVLLTPRPPLAASVYTFTGSFLDEHRDVAKALMRAIVRTNRTYLEGDYHTDQATMTELAEVLSTPIDTLSASPSLTFDPDLGIDASILEACQAVWLAAGVLDYDEVQPLSDMIDTSVVDEVLQGG